MPGWGPETSRGPDWDADVVLARPEGSGLTEGLGAAEKKVTSGKTVTAPDGKQGMITRQSRTTSPPAPCRSAGPPLDVVEWRRCRSREAGFPATLAASLAHMRVDLHALLELVDAGCPPELAARILSPLDDLLMIEDLAPREGIDRVTEAGASW